MQKISFINKVYFKNAQKMKEVPDNAIDLIITSPPYFHIKYYAKNGYQNKTHSKKIKAQSNEKK